MTRWQDDMTTGWQKLPNVAKSCQNEQSHQQVTKMDKKDKYGNMLSNVAKSFQLLAKVIKSCQKLTKKRQIDMIQWWNKWWN